MKYGVTWGLAKAGWRGLCIEPLDASMALCRANHASHAKIEFEQCAVGDFDGDGTLYVCDMAEVSSTHLNEWSRAWGASESKQVPVKFKKLDTILTERDWPRKYDVLSIDVEEAELKVLAGCNLSLWRPKMIIIELHEGESGMNWKAPEATEILQRAGYEKVYFDKINTVFVDKTRGGE